MIACEVCGTRNEVKLTFCRMCGHRLKSRNRAVPPTPAPKAKSPSDANEHDEASSGHSRPSAPSLELPPSTGSKAKRADAAGSDKAKCGACGALSPKEYRFCISCGGVLRAAPPKAASKSTTKGVVPKAAAPKSGLELDKPHPKAEHQSAPSAKSRLGSLKKPKFGGLSSPPAAGEKVCEGCSGENDAEASFCKFCGAALPKRSASSEHAPPRGSAPSQPVELSPSAKKEPFPLAESLIQDDEASPEAARPSGRSAAKASSSDRSDKPSGQLVVIVEDGSEGRVLDLHGRQLDIGCSEGDIILAEDRYLSPRHARFFRQDGAWYLRDLNSVNGVYRRLRKPASLGSGDLVLLGLEVLEFEVVDHAERGLGHAIQHGVLVFGSPAAPRRARLRQRTVEGVVRDVYHLISDETTIGRETGDIVFTSDPFMSRRHAAIQWDGEAEEYVLVDLNSSNGTYLAIRDDVRLDNGDFIRLGQHLFRVDLPQKAR